MEKLFPYLFVDLRLRVTQHLFQSMSQWTLQIKTVLTQFLLVFKNRWKSGTWQKPRDRRLTVTAELVSLKLLKVGKWKQGGRERCLDLRGYQAGLRASAFPSVIKKNKKCEFFSFLKFSTMFPPPRHHIIRQMNSQATTWVGFLFKFCHCQVQHVRGGELVGAPICHTLLKGNCCRGGRNSPLHFWAPLANLRIKLTWDGLTGEKQTKVS